MCVQLLSWCVAACLLLYRGVTTLRREPPVPVPSSVGFGNDTADNETALDPAVDDLLTNAAPGAPGRSTPAPANLLPPAPAGKSASADSAYAAKGDEVSVLYVYSHMNIPAQGAGSWQQQAEAAKAAKAGTEAADGVGGNAQAEAPVAHRSSLSRLRYELRPASLILIVLGFSMLLVGPVVVVLRKCDSTLNHRRGAKLPTDEEDVCDPPPSYDEATLGTSGAPRYSTLFEVRDSGELVCLNTPAPVPASPAEDAGSCAAADGGGHKAEAGGACRKA